MASGVNTHTDAHKHTHAYLHESDFKKPGARKPVAGICWFRNIIVLVRSYVHIDTII